MAAAQEKILEIVKSKTDPNYVVTEIKKLMFGYAKGTRHQGANGRRSPDARAGHQAAPVVGRFAPGQRPDVAHAGAQSGTGPRKFRQGARQRPRQRERPGSADSTCLPTSVDSPKPAARWMRSPRTPGRRFSTSCGPNVMLKVGEAEQAFDEAKKVADARPDDPATQMWFADVASQAKKFDVAEAATKKAVAISIRPIRTCGRRC